MRFLELIFRLLQHREYLDLVDNDFERELQSLFDVVGVSSTDDPAHLLVKLPTRIQDTLDVDRSLHVLTCAVLLQSVLDVIGRELLLGCHASESTVS